MCFSVHVFVLCFYKLTHNNVQGTEQSLSKPSSDKVASWNGTGSPPPAGVSEDENEVSVL